ncbi:GlsB/YeaQ/YmgE family stress response membrane protein [Isosphaeraceae bacterium EP7]
MITSLIAWTVFGFIAGLVGRAIHPGPDDLGIGSTIILGVIGSLVGGGIAYALKLGTSPYQPGGWIMSILGAIIVLAFGFFAARPRAIS